MAHVRQSRGASGVRKVPRSLWEQAGARAGDGAGALFARLDAQDAQDAQDAPTLETPAVRAPSAQRMAVSEAREQGAQALERAAAAIRAGAWNAALAELVAAAVDLRIPGSDVDGERGPRG